MKDSLGKTRRSNASLHSRYNGRLFLLDSIPSPVFNLRSVATSSAPARCSSFNLEFSLMRRLQDFSSAILSRAYFFYGSFSSVSSVSGSPVQKPFNLLRKKSKHMMAVLCSSPLCPSSFSLFNLSLAPISRLVSASISEAIDDLCADAFFLTPPALTSPPSKTPLFSRTI